MRGTGLLVPAAVFACALAAGGCAGDPAGAPAEAGPWARFRGPDGQGLSDETGLPTTWSGDSPNLRWKAVIPGRGNSSPIVSAGKVFLTTAVRDGAELVREVVALDLDSGELVWRVPVVSGPGEALHPYNTHAAVTPVSDGETVWAHFGSHLAAIAHDGELRWKVEIDRDYVEHSRYGAASSPVLFENLVIVAQDRELETKPLGWIAAFDRASGDEVWRTSWDSTCCSYVTPIFVDRGAGEEMLFFHTDFVAGYDPLSGEELWRRHVKIWQPVPSPVIENGLLAVAGGGNQVRGTAVLDLTASSEDGAPPVLWFTDRRAPKTASPVLLDGLLYVVAENGVTTCYEARTGRVVWGGRLTRGNYRSSLVAGDGKIYVVSSEGATTVLATGPRFAQLSVNSLGEGSNASPAIADGSLLIRTASGLVRIDAEAGSEATAPPAAEAGSSGG